jgi:hypothetical protein
LGGRVFAWDREDDKEQGIVVMELAALNGHLEGMKWLYKNGAKNVRFQ